LIYDFGECPLAGYFPEPDKASLDNLISMKLIFCAACELVQITPNVDDDFLFSDYRYISSVGMTDHFESLVLWLIENQYIETSQGKKKVTTGLRNAQFVEITSGIDTEMEIILPQ
jgi:hypothetical protein